MKKHLLLLTLTGLSFFNGFAQIFIAQYDIPQIGAIRYSAVDTVDFSGIDLGSIGENQIWDFTSLSNHGRDTLEFTNPNWTPYAASFSGANLAIINGDITSIGVATSTGIEWMGYGIKLAGEPIAVPFQNRQTFLTYPFTYQSNISDVSNADITLPVAFSPNSDSTRLKNHTSISKAVDAYGEATTPTGHYNVIRTKIREISNDSVWAYMSSIPNWQLIKAGIDTVYRYEFLTQVLGAVATFEVDKNDNIYKAEYYLSSAVGIDEVYDNAQISVYPNPSNGNIYLNGSLDNNSTLTFFDITGREIKGYALGSGTNHLDISGISAGLYLYHIINSQNQLVKTGKLQISQ